MNAALTRDHPAFRAEALRLKGERARRDARSTCSIRIRALRVGTVPLASVDDVRAAFEYAAAYRSTLTRYERSQILERAAALLRERTEAASDLISLESGLVEAGLALRDRPRGRCVEVRGDRSVARRRPELFVRSDAAWQEAPRVYAARTAAGVIVAITPFNHPMNQVAHKIAPAIATNNRVSAEAVGESAAVGVLPGRHSL